MNTLVKSFVIALVIFLLVIFILWTGYILIFGGFFGGCPPAYIVQKVNAPDLSGPEPVSVIHITDEDFISRPYLKEAFEDEERILLPVRHPIDLVPGNIFGPEYATHRMPTRERDDFLAAYRNDTIWEHNGTYIRFIALAC
jgi:hypothetical protein